MSFKFDEEIDRFDTHCMKWEYEIIDEEKVQTDRSHPKYGDDQVLPLWVADMDFKSPPQVIKALEERAAHGLYGYSMPADCYYEALQEWMARRYGRAIDRDWVVITPGVHTALTALVQTFSEPGDKVLIQSPVYHPFYTSIEDNGRIIARNPLKLTENGYEMDFEDLALKVADPAVKMAILCSPHNPIGRVWSREELTRFGEICRDNDVLVISDEVHSDLILEGYAFTGFDAISDEFARSSIICTAASKSFNLAGLKTSNIIVQDADLRGAFKKTLNSSSILGSGAFGIVATEAAYRHGEAWLEAVIAYVQANYRYLKAYLAEYLPQLRVLPLQGTYLVWIDFRALNMSPVERKTLLMDEAKVWLNEGIMFGPDGADFERINIACPRSLLEEALRRIHSAVESLS